MSSTNVFRNTYSAPENRLTYNFFCTIDLMTAGQQGLIEFLTKERNIQVSNNPIDGIKPLFAFEKARSPADEASNPDGCIKVRRKDGAIIQIFLEIKTHRRALTDEQLRRHLKCHVDQAPDALLLVITPRPSDLKIVQQMNDERIIFVSWQKIADYLAKTDFVLSDEKIVKQFLKHSQGEFMATELEKEDISLIIGNYQRRPDERLKGAFERLGAEFPFDKYLSRQLEPWWEVAWGRKGINISIEKEKLRRWISFGIYYDTEDHLIPFKEDMPELALFIDINPELRSTLQNIPDFVEALHNLENVGWEENITKQNTSNQWRLLYWRRPLSEFTELNTQILSVVLKARLEELAGESAIRQNYLRNMSSGQIQNP